MLKRKHGATSCHVRGDGALILTRGSGKKMVQLMVPANALAVVEERVRTHVQPYRNELEAIMLGAKPKAKGGKPDQGKRIR